MALLNPYISFRDNAGEAMAFYHSVFGGELNVMTFGQMGDAGPYAEKIMHAMLTTPDGFTLMGSDTPPGMEFSPGTQISISLSGDEAETLRGYFTKLGEGGQELMPLEKQVWGDEFGSVVDRFGIQWLVNIAAGSQD